MYEIITWGKVLKKVNMTKLCNYINDKNEIIDIISLQPLPIKNIKNPKDLVLLINLINGSTVIHDIISFKDWLEKVGSFKEPLSNYRLPNIILDDIKYKIWESKKFLNKIIIATSYGIKKFTTNLLENAINNDETFDDEYVILIHIGSLITNHKYIINTIGTSVPNKYIIDDIYRLISNQDIEEYDFILDNCKIVLNNNLIEFNVIDNDLKISTFTKFNNLIRYKITSIIIKSNCILSTILIEKILNYIGNSTGKREIMIDIHNLKYNNKLYLNTIKNKNIAWYINSDNLVILPQKNTCIGLYTTNSKNVKKIINENKNVYEIRSSYL